MTILVLTQSVMLINAQNSIEEKYYVDDGRHWTIDVPLWIPGFRGQFAYGDFNASASGSDKEREFERISANTGLEFYFVGRVMAQYKKFWMQVDAFSGKVGSTFTYIPKFGDNERDFVNISVHGTLPRLSFGYTIWEKTTESNFNIELIPYIGLRYVNVRLQSGVVDSLFVIDVRANWVEPAIGLSVPLSYKRFRVELQADYGAIKSKSTWVLTGRVRYRISKLIDVQVGCALVNMKHKDNIGDELLDLNIRLFGPTAGIAFRF